nr:uncharacterized protein CFP56_09570 [Quercus suber]
MDTLQGKVTSGRGELCSVCPTTINFKLGWPNPALLPVQELRDACQAVLSEPRCFTKESPLEYGPEDGYVLLREAIAEWMNNFYIPRSAVNPSRICISGGASQNLSCVLQTFTDPAYTKIIWMVAPTYFCACRVFDDCGFAGRLRAVPEDTEGLDIAYLSEQLANADAEPHVYQSPTKTPRSWNKTYRHVIYCVPTFANPSGRVMSLARREALVRLARVHDALIVTDDVYDMLQWDESPSEKGSTHKVACQPRLVDLDAYLDGGPVDKFGHSVSQGSFSKIVGPGLRTGWAEGTPEFVWGLSQCGATRSGGCGSQFTAAILAKIVHTSLPPYLHNVVQPTYARRYHLFMAAARKYLLPLGVELMSPNESGVMGGYYVWLQFPDAVNVSDVVKIAAEQYHLLLHPGILFMVEGDNAECQTTFVNGVRVCFVWEEEHLLEEGVMRLAVFRKIRVIVLRTKCTASMVELRTIPKDALTFPHGFIDRLSAHFYLNTFDVDSFPRKSRSGRRNTFHISDRQHEGSPPQISNRISRTKLIRLNFTLTDMIMLAVCLVIGSVVYYQPLTQNYSNMHQRHTKRHAKTGGSRDFHCSGGFGKIRVNVCGKIAASHSMFASRVARIVLATASLSSITHKVGTGRSDVQLYDW